MNLAVASPLGGRRAPKFVLPFRNDNPPALQAVRIQLSEILKSDGFVHAARMRHFLEFVVEETLAGRASQVCEYSIGVSVYKRGGSFEPGADPIVRNDARRLRQKLHEYYQRPRFKSDGQIMIDIPKGAYVPVFSYTSHPNAQMSGGRYRLSVKLIRIADDAEIWAAEEEVRILEDSAGQRFALQFEIKNQISPLTMLPLSRSSDRAQRSNRSLERQARR